MNDESSTSDQETKSWLEKITHVFTGDSKQSNEVLDFLVEARERQLLDGVSFQIIEGAIEVADMKVRDIMIPRVQMVIVKDSQTPEQFLPTIIESGHSRFPVIGDNADEVIGVLLAKDLLPIILGEVEKFKLKDILRPVTVIPESKRLTALLNEFRTNRNHMAIVVDEYGGVSGMVTIEDVLEEIVGEIEDEYDIDEEDSYIRDTEDGRCVVNALTPIEDFNEHFQIDFNDQEFDTIGGIIMQHFGRLPRPNESIEIGGLNFQVLTADKRRIRLLQVTPLAA